VDSDHRLKRLRYRAWHRGTREADMMIGGFFDHAHATWSETEMDWFEAFLEEQDVDIMAWTIGTQPIPTRWQGEMMTALKKLDFIDIPQ
jgi:antitoxin CptB